METIVALNKPVIPTPDLRGCKNVGDLLSALKAFKWDSFNDTETFLYIVHGADGVEIPLNGPHYDPERPLSPTADSVLHISARPMHFEYDVLICLPREKFKHPWPAYGQRIHAQYGIPTNTFMLLFGGTSISDPASLTEQNILSGCIVTVRLSVSITYRFKQDIHTSWVWADDKLTALLEDITKRTDERHEHIRFAIIKCSGAVTGEAEEWLSEWSDSFSANRVTGTVEENGFRSGDRIQVYRLPQNLTKKRESVCNESSVSDDFERR